MDNLIDSIFAAEKNETEIMIDYHSPLVTFRLQFVPMDVMIGDNVLEMYDAVHGEDVKIIINTQETLKYDQEYGEYHIEHNGGDMIIGFA